MTRALALLTLFCASIWADSRGWHDVADVGCRLCFAVVATIAVYSIMPKADG